MAIRPLVIGHRGASRDAPENTLAAFRLAFEQGADGIEADFRLTGDGSIVCHHDVTTLRTAGKRLPVARATLSQLRVLDVGAWKGERWRGERIPTLQEVLALLPSGKRLFLEVKSGPDIMVPLEKVLTTAPVSPDLVRLMCFDPQMVRLFKERLPWYRALWLTDYRWLGGWHPAPEEVLATIDACGADGLASRGNRVLDEPFVSALKRQGSEIHVWTVDAVAAARRFSHLGVDAIMTNRPSWLGPFLNSVAAAPRVRRRP